MTKKIGKPKGSGQGQQIVGKLRMEILRALDENARKNKHLHLLIAEQIEEDAAGTLQKLSRFLPQEIDLGENANEFTQALQRVSERIEEANRILDLKPLPLEGNAPDAQVIDITQENTSDLDKE